MLLRSIVLMITGILSFVPVSYAANVDSLLEKYIAIPKPYIIIYIPSNDCEFHRGAEARRAILEMKLAIPAEKMLVLFDDDLMRTHYKTYPDVYEGMKVCYSKEIADALPRRIGSRMGLVTDDSISYYKLPVSFYDFNYIVNTIAPYYDTAAVSDEAASIAPYETDYNLTDGMFADKYMNFEFNKKTSIFQADRFQTGLIKWGNKTTFTESTLDDSSLTFLYHMLSRYVTDSFRTVNHTKSELQVDMMPLVDLKNIRIADNEAYVLFNLSTVSEKKTFDIWPGDYSPEKRKFDIPVYNPNSDKHDTCYKSILRKTFIAKVDLTKKDNPFNLSLSNCEGYSWLNYRELDGEFHAPIEGINIEAIHDTIFVPLHAHKIGSKDADKEDISVGAYIFNNMNKLVLTKIYRTPFNDNRIHQHLLRAKNGHEPFMIDRVRKSVTTLADNREIRLDEYVSEIFDAQIRDKGIVFAGLNNKKQTTVSFFDFKSNTVTSSRIIDTAAATNATIAANIVQWYRKDNNQKLKLSSYPIKDFGTTTPSATSLRMTKN